MRDDLATEVDEIKQGDVADFRNFIGAVIDERAFEKQRQALALASRTDGVKVVAGGRTDGSVGWFVRPTVLETADAAFRLMREELFGPVLTVFPYSDGDWEGVLDLCDQTSPYALTGAVFATDRAAIRIAGERLVHAAGNFYINDKPTGAVVGMQPFGGSRASGTNDKAGSGINLQRWVTPRAIKETYVPARDYRYPFMGEA
jgi:1-pyrroline-5-carboxylate dehydrogenase